MENVSLDHTFAISNQQAASILRILLNRYSRDLKKINRDIDERQQLDHTKCVQIVAFLVGMLLVTDWGKNA